MACHTPVDNYPGSFYHAVFAAGYRLKHLLDLSTVSAEGADSAFTHLERFRLPTEWSDVVALHLTFLSALRAGDLEKAYSKLAAALQSFLKVEHASISF